MLLDTLNAKVSLPTRDAYFRNIIDFGLGMGSFDEDAGDGAARVQLNQIAATLGLPSIGGQDTGTAARAKINALRAGLGLAQNLDLYADLTKGRYFDGQAWAPANKIADTWSGGLVETSTGYVSKGANALAIGDLGMQTVPTRTNSIRRNNMGGVVPGTPGTLPGAGASGWVAPNTTNGLTRQIVETGTDPVTGLPYIDILYSGTTATASSLNIQFEAQGQIAGTMGQTWTHSGYLALISGSLAGVTSATFRLAQYNGSAAYVGDVPTAPSILGMTGTLSRFIQTGALNQAASATIVPYIQVAYPSGLALNFRIRIAGCQLELGAFVTPPIITAGAAVTRTGNRQMIDLTGRLVDGVAGFIKIDARVIGVSAERILEFNDGTSSNRFLLGHATTNLSMIATSGGVAQASVASMPLSAGMKTIVFACSNNFFKARVVGGTDVAADVSGSMPLGMNKLAVGGTGFSDLSNSYQYARKPALRFGPVNQAVFDEVYALALAA